MTHINERRDPAATWAVNNPVLMEGEVGWEKDTGKSKLGDGVTPWNSLPYARGLGTKADVGLSNVDNTSDLNKPVSTATQAALNAKANTASPILTGIPRAPTPPTSDSSTRISTTQYVRNQFTDTALAGTPTIVTTPVTSSNDHTAANTAFVQAAIAAADAALIVNGASSIKIGSLLIQWGSATVDVSGAGAGTLFTQSITWPVPFSGAPYFANASVSGFVSGSSGTTPKGVDSLTTTTGRAVFLNTSDSSATFTGLPFRFWAIGPA